MKPPVGPKVVIKGLGEDERVGDHRSVRVIADQQHGPRDRDVVKAADVSAEVHTREQPQRRQRFADVLRIALVQRVDLPTSIQGADHIRRGGSEHAQSSLQRIRGGTQQTAQDTPADCNQTTIYARLMGARSDQPPPLTGHGIQRVINVGSDESRRAAVHMRRHTDHST